MATYKVLQDIEAEDKLIGPLTFKQFVFAIITFMFMGVSFMFSQINILLSLPWILPIVVFGFLASPIGKDQPNEVWLAARIRFMLKPRIRKWDQAGMEELVTITVPKKIEIQRTNNLSEHEVKSRLTALANTLDSRGWAIKNVGEEMFNQPSYRNGSNSERLINISALQQDVPIANIQDSEDILDAENNPLAIRLDSAIKAHQQNKITQLKTAITSSYTPPAVPFPKADYSFITTQNSLEPGYTTFGSQVVNPGKNINSNDLSLTNSSNQLSVTEEQFLNKRHEDIARQHSVHYRGNDHVVMPVDINQNTVNTQNNKVTQTAPDVILKKLGQNNDLSISAVASLAKHAEQEKTFNNDDTISLH